MWEEVSISAAGSGRVLSFSVIAIYPSRIHPTRTSVTLAEGGSAETPHGRWLFLRTLQNELRPNQAKATVQPIAIASAADANLSSVIFSVFLKRGAAEAEGHDQKNHSRHLQPELVGDMQEGPGRRLDGAHDGAERAVAARLLARDPRHHPNLSPSGNFAHGLDFNSLRRYNDATLVTGEPLRR